MDLKSSVIVYPTDTVWGIGCDIYNQQLVSYVHEIKGADHSKPVSVAVGSIRELEAFISLDKFLKPDQLTKLFSFKISIGLSKNLLNKEIPSWILGDSSLVVFRVLPLDFLQELSCPIVTTSLNFKGKPSIIEKSKAIDFFNEITYSNKVMIEEDQLKPDGLSSTIITLTPNYDYQFLRKGSDAYEIEKFLLSLN